MSRMCLRCTETQADDSLMYDAKDYTTELSEEKIQYDPLYQLCQTCVDQYEHAKWLKEATKSGPDCESNEQALQVLREEEQTS